MHQFSNFCVRFVGVFVERVIVDQVRTAGAREYII